MALKQQLGEAVMKKEYCRLNEGRNADKAKEKTLEVIRNFFNNASWIDDEFVDAVANPNHLSVINYIENRLKERCFHANIPDAVIRLEPIIMNIALSLGFEQGNPDTAKLNRLFRIITYITKCVKEKLELPIQLNTLTLENTTYDRLNDVFGTILDKQDAEEEERINNADYSEGINTDYDILSDIDYATANKYGNHSCSGSKLCYTQSESTWNQYTNGGSNTVYLLLHKDWEEIAEEHGADTPYDDYGLSMIFVFIDEEGNIAYSNTRWNHETNGQGPSNVDQSFTKEMLSKLLNTKFGEVFKPLHTFAEKVAEVKRQLQNGADPKDVFNWASDFDNGIACVQLGNKYNHINTNGELISDLWFDWVYLFYKGFAKVSLKNRGWNVINTNGELISDLWFDWVYLLHDGFIAVRLNDRGYNLINTKGEPISDLWFDKVYDFSNGFARVYVKDRGWNFINTNGELISDLWFDKACDFKEGFAWVYVKDKGWLQIDTEGNLYDKDKNLINKTNEN